MKIQTLSPLGFLSRFKDFPLSYQLIPIPLTRLIPLHTVIWDLWRFGLYSILLVRARFQHPSLLEHLLTWVHLASQGFQALCSNPNRLLPYGYGTYWCEFHEWIRQLVLAIYSLHNEIPSADFLVYIVPFVFDVSRSSVVGVTVTLAVTRFAPGSVDYNYDEWQT